MPAVLAMKGGRVVIAKPHEMVLTRRRILTLHGLVFNCLFGLVAGPSHLLHRHFVFAAITAFPKAEPQRTLFLLPLQLPLWRLAAFDFRRH
jgi:hypothetical protein